MTAQPNDIGRAARPVTQFFVLVFLLSVPFLVVGQIAGSLPGIPNNLPASALMFVCPGAAALILLRVQQGPRSVRRLLRRALRVAPARWIVAAVAVFPLLALGSYAVLWLAGAAEPTAGGGWIAVPVYFVVFAVSAFGEELGWTGYATVRLRRQHGVLATGTSIGIVWAVWHLVPLLQAGRAPGWIAAWAIATVATRIVIVGLYHLSGRYQLTAILAHAMSNVVASVVPGYPATATMVAVAGGTALGALAVVTVRPGARRALPTARRRTTAFYRGIR